MTETDPALHESPSRCPSQIRALSFPRFSGHVGACETEGNSTEGASAVSDSADPGEGGWMGTIGIEPVTSAV